MTVYRQLTVLGMIWGCFGDVLQILWGFFGMLDSKSRDLSAKRVTRSTGKIDGLTSQHGISTLASKNQKLKRFHSLDFDEISISGYSQV